MLKAIGKFAVLTLGLAFVGSVLLTVGVITSSGGQIGFLSTIGILIFMLSPFLAGFWLWLGFKKQRRFTDYREQQRQLEEKKATDEEDQKAFLRRRFLERQRLLESVDHHRTTLTRNIERAIKKNDYGVLVEDKSSDALHEFFASIDLDINMIDADEAIELVLEQLDIRAEEDRQGGFDSTNLPFDGHAFEKWVAEALIGFGWEAEVTSGSGDQGIDVIAKKEGKKLGIQCKLYSSAIGNKAVQEAHAGKSYYNADAVAVLSNASYTSSAKDLARVTGVELLSHHDIPDLFEKVFSL